MSPKKFTLNKGKGKGGANGEASGAMTGAEVTQKMHQLQEEARPKVARLIPIDRIRPNPYQKRLDFDDGKLQELANGMGEHGWIGGGLPVRNDPEETNAYQLVWGERRLRAAKLARLTAIPCEISTYTDDDMAELGLLENVQRENLTNYELGMAYKSLLALQVDGKPKYSIRTLAKRLGFNDKSAIERMLVYARAPEDVQELAKAKPDVAPRIVHELAHIETEEERAPIIEAVLKGQTDIEDVRALRKQISLSQQEAQEMSEEVSEEGASDIVEVKRPAQSRPSPAKSERVGRLVVERRIKKDHERVIECLTHWAQNRASLDDKTLPALLHSLTLWETSIAQLKQSLQDDRPY